MIFVNSAAMKLVSTQSFVEQIERMRGAIERIGPPPDSEMKMHPVDVAMLVRHYGVQRMPDSMIATIRIIEDAEVLPLPCVR